MFCLGPYAGQACHHALLLEQLTTGLWCAWHPCLYAYMPSFQEVEDPQWSDDHGQEHYLFSISILQRKERSAFWFGEGCLLQTGLPNSHSDSAGQTGRKKDRPLTSLPAFKIQGQEKNTNCQQDFKPEEKEEEGRKKDFPVLRTGRTVQKQRNPAWFGRDDCGRQYVTLLCGLM